jgi:hypothetical protein
MKCNCGFEKYKRHFGSIEYGGCGEYDCLIGRIRGHHVGSVDIYVCPKCGALYTDMRGEIKNS